jgi:hypothetical protein
MKLGKENPMKTLGSIRSSIAAIAAVAGTFFLAGGLAATPAGATPVPHSCGKVMNSFVKTEMSPFTTYSNVFKEVTGAYQTITIPAGTSRCVKVRFSADAFCNNAAGHCLVYVSTDSANFDPAGYRVLQAWGGESAASFDWVKRLDAGTHTIHVKAAVYYGGALFSIDSWTMDVEIAK